MTPSILTGNSNTELCGDQLSIGLGKDLMSRSIVEYG